MLATSIPLKGPNSPLLGTVVMAGEALGGQRAVVLDSLGAARYASNTSPSHLARLVGITTGAAVTGAPVTLASFGSVTEPSWSWTPNAPVFLATNGLLNQTPPVSGFSQVVGIAMSATNIFINPREPIVII